MAELPETQAVRQPTLIDATIPLIALAVSIGSSIALFGLGALDGPIQVALVLPSRVFRVEFEWRGLAPQNLSRLAADSGTVTSPLMPWNSCGAFMGAVLGVATLSYLPFAVFNIASPLLSVVYGFTGFKIVKTTSADETGDDS
jgi:NhaC family Na+:H+ antiporter